MVEAFGITTCGVSAHRAVLFVVISVGMSLGLPGCDTLTALLDQSSKPSAKLNGVKLQGLSLESVTLAFNVDVTNPYTFPLPLADVDYALSGQGQPFMLGKANLAGTIPAGGAKTFTVPATVRFMDLLKVLKTVKPGAVVAYQAQLGLSIDVPQTGPMRLPIKTQGKIPIPAVPGVELTDVNWKSLSLRDASAVISLQLTNRNAFPVNLQQMDYGLTLAGQRVAQSSLKSAAVFESGKPQMVQIPISISPIQMGVSVLQRSPGQRGSLRDRRPDEPQQLVRRYEPALQQKRTDSVLAVRRRCHGCRPSSWYPYVC